MNVACGAEVLVSDDGFDDGFILRLGGGGGAKEVVGDDAAVEFEGEVRGRHIGGRRADVVQ